MKNKFDKFYQSYLDWYEAFSPTNLTLSTIKLGEEAGEVMEAILAFHGSQSKIKKLRKKGQAPKESIIEEVGDVIRVALNIATLAGVSHADVFDEATKKNRTRTKKCLKTKTTKMK